MANKVKIKVKRTGRVRTPQLTDPQMKAIGEEMVAAQKERWRDAINANGVPAKKLSIKYFFIKRKLHGGGTPVRDMNLTGKLIKNFQLRKATTNQIRAENTTRKEREKAMGAQ